MAEDKAGKETKPEAERRNWAGAISGDASAAASSAFARAGFRDPTLVLRWSEIVGADVAKLATPVKLSESANGGVLTLKSEPGAAVFLQHETRALTERINGYLGRPAVARLRFIQGPLLRKSEPVKRRRPPASAPPGDVAYRYNGPDQVREALLRLARVRRTPTDQAD